MIIVLAVILIVVLLVLVDKTVTIYPDIQPLAVHASLGSSDE